MAKYYFIFLFTALFVFIADQNIKFLFVSGLYWESKCISLTLTFNKGVAFSMLSFLGEYLKYIQAVLIGGITIYILSHKEIVKRYAFSVGMLIGAAFSNLFDRFLHGGVVDFVYWHCGFDFAVFNIADVLIDLSVVLILYTHYKYSKKSEI